MDKKLAYFKENYDALCARYGGRYVAVTETSVLGDYASFDEAYEQTIKTERLGSFLIQYCGDEGVVASFPWCNVSFEEELVYA
jgi:hypothetical protein